jgi:hypothetical protein
MIENMKKEITEALKKIENSTELKDIKEILSNSVSSTLEKAKGAKDYTVDLSDVAIEAISSSVDSLKETGNDTKDKVSASIEGTIEGINQIKRERIENMDRDLVLAKEAILDQKDELVKQTVDVVDAIKQKTETYSDDLKEIFEDILSNAKNLIKDSEKKS